MRILVLSDTFPPENRGGAGAVAWAVADALRARGHQVLVLTTTAEQMPRAGTENRLRVVRLKQLPPGPWQLYLSLYRPDAAAAARRLVDEFAPDAVHAHNVHQHLSFGALAAVSGPPLVLTAHDYLLFCHSRFLCSAGDPSLRARPLLCRHCRLRAWRLPLRNAFVRRTVRRHVGRVVCVSDAQRRAVAANGFAGRSRDGRPLLETIYNGVDALAPSASPEEAAGFRRERGLGNGRAVLFGGRLSGAKGGEQLLRALDRARKRGADASLWVAGARPDYEQRLQELARELGLSSRLHLLGWLDQAELRRAFAACDVCATPSIHPDPFNLMNVEAMAAARPVVATCYGGAPEIVVDGVTGYVADPLKPDVFGDRLADVLANPERARAMGEAGRERVCELFTLSRQVQRYLDLFHRLMSPSHSDMRAE